MSDLRAALIRLAHEERPLRAHLLPLLATYDFRMAADEGGDEDAKSSGSSGKPSGEFIEFMKEMGDSKIRNPDTGNVVKLKSLKGDRGQALVKQEFKKWLSSRKEKGGEEKGGDSGKKDEKSEKGQTSRLQSFLSGVKGVPKAISESLSSAKAQVQEFVANPEKRREVTTQMATAIREAPSKIGEKVWAAAKKEAHEIQHAGHALKKALGTEVSELTPEDKKALYGASLYVAGAAIAAVGGGALMAAGAVGKSFAAHVAAKAVHGMLDTAFTHFEAFETLHTAGEMAKHLLSYASRVAAEKGEKGKEMSDEDYQKMLVALVIAQLHEEMEKGVSDKDMEKILRDEKFDTNSIPQPKKKKKSASPYGATMPNLRASLVRLAYENPSLRADILPLLVKEAKSFEDAVKGKKFKNPETGNEVQFGSLPSEEQSRIRKQWVKKNPRGSGGEGSDPKEMLKEDSDKYFAQHVSGGISKKSLSDALKGTGWSPRGKGTFDKKRGFVELYLDNPESRSGPLRVVFSGSDYTKGDGKGYVRVEHPKHGQVDDAFEMTGDPAADAKKMHETLRELTEGMAEYDKPAKPAKKPGQPPAEGKKKPSFKKNYRRKMESVMKKHDLTDDDAAQVIDFSLARPKKGKPQSPAELMRRFMQNAKPETKARMKNMTPADFMVMLRSILDQEEEVGKMASFRSAVIRLAQENPALRKHVLAAIKEADEGSPEADKAELKKDADPKSHDQNLASTWEKVDGSKKASRKVAYGQGRTVVDSDSITSKTSDPQVYDTWLLTSRARNGRKAQTAARAVLSKYRSQLESMTAGQAVDFVDQKVMEMTGKRPDWHYYVMPD